MSLQRYPEYRDSGINWLPTVPSHWDVCALKRVASLKSGDSITSEQISEVGDYAVYGGNGLRGFTSSFTHNGRYAIVGRQGALCGNVNYAQGRFWASEHALVATPIKPVETTYLGELLRAMNLNQYSVSAAQPGLSAELISNIGVPYPPLNEQAAIATYLDRETAKIDALIAEQEKLIALLAEKRQATISHAVTRGLNPDAPMKDSGVQWLGEVPAHWRVGKTGFYASVLSGYAFPSTGFSLDDSYARLLRGINVGVGELRWDEVVYWKRETGDGLDAFELAAGDVVIGMDRPLISTGMRVAIVRQADLPCLLLQRVAKIQSGPQLYGRFIMRLLSSRAFEAHFAPETTGVSVPHISGEQISDFRIPVPPVIEQRDICDFLDEELVRLDKLGAEAAHAIDLLRERRSALIAAAVTGQIDVRGAVPTCEEV